VESTDGDRGDAAIQTDDIYGFKSIFGGPIPLFAMPVVPPALDPSRFGERAGVVVERRNLCRP
jgi:hypothetical protein